MPVQVKVTFIPTPGNKAALEAVLRPLLLASVLPDGCSGAVIQSSLNEQELIIMENWSSVEVHEAYFEELIRAERLEGIRHLFNKMFYSYISNGT